jgi:phenylalanyl-tRNA synthetase beta chain
VFGELHPEYGEIFKLRQRVYLAEVDIAFLLAARKHSSIAPVPKFPSIRRDLSLLLNKGTFYGQVRETVLALNIRELIQVEPFDRLARGSFPETKFALAISLIYQSPERTLTDEEVENFDRKILDSLREHLGAELRT